jgi:hypothetical protein
MAVLAILASASGASAQTCTNTKVANVVALDQPFMWNRLGAAEPQGMIFALKRDVVSSTGGSTLTPGNVKLRDGKRPRPLTLRINVGDCIQINFTNLLNPIPEDEEQPATRTASVHVVGLQLVNSMISDGSNVGSIAPIGGLASPGQSKTYTYYAEREGTYLIHSGAALVSGDGDGGTISTGLFGAVNVQPTQAEYYRSQVTEVELALATKKTSGGAPITTPGGQPVVDYNAVYPGTTTPILRMTQGNEIIYSDLTAIITGPGAGRFPAGTYPAIKVSPDRLQPFREFTIIFHDEIAAVQAFPQFEDPVLMHTLHSARDAFAINYGTGGIGAEILANRIGVGPMANCVDCKYEEFFLSAWTVGDPAMVVDKPANAPCTPDDIRNGNPCTPSPGFKATKAFFPEDPSNVYHSYMNDHVKFRNLHAGSDDHHIFHLHAHQWLKTPDSDNSTYMDSQAIGQGTGFTYEIAHNGSGNRNKTVGDSIFHCHFYPHFAQGMWAMWRVHDVFESGTKLDADGRPAVGSRALPDAEIKAGTPIPGLVPLPTIAMAPMPQAVATIVNGQVNIAGNGNPGWPFFVAALAGQRPPKPPLDTVDDGGLPRHIVLNGTAVSVENRLDFSKEMITANAQGIPETGTPVEIAAMAFHAIRNHASFKPDGTAATFTTNGRPAIKGAPFADPCIDDNGNPIGNQRYYKAAGFQLDLKLNKSGWHFPQSRILALWEDVNPTLNGTRVAEPFFFRANTNDCITFYHTNLLPMVYEVDDFQVRTPTDIIGQHIHLVKFDVTASDGAGNGFNYEDGTFAPDEVVERIEAINANGGLIPFGGGARVHLEPEAHPFFGAGPDLNGDGVGDWLGAQTTVQRWFADNVLNNSNQDRTLRTVFSHDHFGPSTHQQAGLYAGLVLEPQGSQWRHPETGVFFGTRVTDGGPTSWRADIITTVASQSYREYLLEFADFQLAYYRGGGGNAANPVPDPPNAVNPPGRERIGLPFIFRRPQQCPGGVAPPCPEAVSADDPGTFSVNYRNEPVALRVRNPQTNTQSPGLAGDLSHALRSTVQRLDPDFDNTLNPYTQWDVKPLTPGVLPGDPATPMLRAYQRDNVQVRVLVGAHEEEHNFSFHGTKWLLEPSDPNSGYRNSQMMGISEHWEFVMPRFISPLNRPFADFLYTPNTSAEGFWNGTWGLLRVYRDPQPDLLTLPNNDVRQLPPLDKSNTVTSISIDTTAASDPTSTRGTAGGSATSDTDADPATGDTATSTDGATAGDTTTDDSTSDASRGISPRTLPRPPTRLNFIGRGACPLSAPLRIFDVTARLARDALPGGTLLYNPRIKTVTDPDSGASHTGPLHDPTAIIYFRTTDLDTQGKLINGRPIEPLILRANAGDCIAVLLRNALPQDVPDLDGFSGMPNIIDKFNINQVKPSSHVGLHSQLLYYNVTRSDGNNVGYNDVQTAPPGGFQVYLWYAGDVKIQTVSGVDKVTFTPVEFGSTNLIPADRVKHTNKGAVGGLIIEPQGSNWVEDTNQRAAANIRQGTTPLFREFVTIFQSDLHIRYGDGSAIRELVVNEDAQENGQKAINYRAEPIWYRMGHAPETTMETTRTFDFTNMLSNTIVAGLPVDPNYPAVMMPPLSGDPFTPIFTATRGTAVRFRVLNPGGHTQSHVFEVHGHIWEEEPYINNSTQLGTNTKSQWKGSLYGHGPTNHFDALLKNGAGGKFRVTGDYLYRDYVPWYFDNGLWGIFRVTN